MRVVVVVVLSVVLTSCLGYDISPCGQNGRTRIEEGQDAVFTCTGTGHDVITWAVTPADGVITNIPCPWPSNGPCNTDHASAGYSVSRPQYNTIMLTITGNVRISGLQCAGLVDGAFIESAICDVRVMYTNYTVGSCTTSVDTTTTNWTVGGSCHVTKIYDTDGDPTCSWQHYQSQTTFLGQASLTSFREGGQVYYNMTCSFTDQPLPSGDGGHYYLLILNPRRQDNEVHPNVLTLVSPKYGPVLHNCSDVIVDGDDVTCTCVASQADPPALVTWHSSNRPVSSSDTLMVTNVQKPQSGHSHSYSCRQYWGGYDVTHLRETIYTFQVKYPPTQPPVISGNSKSRVGDNVTMTCTVTGGLPPVQSVIFSCGRHDDSDDVTITSEDGHPAVTSTVTIESVTGQDDGSVCVCSAVWAERPSLYTATVTVTLIVIGASGEVTQGTASGAATTTTALARFADDDDDDDSSWQLAAIVGGVLAVIIIALVIVIVVIVVLWKRGRTVTRDPLYSLPTRQGEEHIYSTSATQIETSDTVPDQTYVITDNTTEAESEGQPVDTTPDQDYVIMDNTTEAESEGQPVDTTPDQDYVITDNAGTRTGGHQEATAASVQAVTHDGSYINTAQLPPAEGHYEIAIEEKHDSPGGHYENVK